MFGTPLKASTVRNLLQQRSLAVAATVLLTGLGAAWTAVLLKNGMTRMVSWRLGLVEQLEPVLGPATPWLVLPVIAGLGGLLAGLLLKHLSPAAHGSGITQVMKFLQGQRVPMSIRVAVVKLLGGVLAIGGGFPLGPEGPAVQMGASVACQMAANLRAPRSFLRLIVAAGGGAGIAAVFNAPLGGFIYAIEELLHNARPVVLMLVLFTTFMADTWGDVLSWIGFGQEQGFSAAMSLEVSKTFDLVDFTFRPVDIFYLVLLGLVIAGLSELYNRYVIAMQGVCGRVFGPRPVLRMALCGLLLGLIFAPLPAEFADGAALKKLVALDLRDGTADLGVNLAIFVAMFFTTGLAAASGAPGGLFAPMLILGGAVGLVSSALLQTTTGYAPSSLVFAGMASFVAGTCQVPIAATFITFALTKQIV
ncbi:chloride channel protein, partial [Candidatus Synechococcus spongiarum]